MIFSQTLSDALNAGIQSVVVLGTGFDTLAYRVPDLASRQVYEVDLPQIIQSKEAELQRLFGRVPAHVKLVSIDFDSQELEVVLQQAEYSGAKPTFFVWEGVTQYVSETAVRKVFGFLRKASPGSQLVFTYVRKDFIDGKQMYGLSVLYHQTRVRKQLWQFGWEPEAVRAFLDQYSWKELEQVGSTEYQERYLEPANRSLLVMEVERAVHAEGDEPLQGDQMPALNAQQHRRVLWIESGEGRIAIKTLWVLPVLTILILLAVGCQSGATTATSLSPTATRLPVATPTPLLSNPGPTIRSLTSCWPTAVVHWPWSSLYPRASWSAALMRPTRS